MVITGEEKILNDKKLSEILDTKSWLALKIVYAMDPINLIVSSLRNCLGVKLPTVPWCTRKGINADRKCHLCVYAPPFIIIR